MLSKSKAQDNIYIGGTLNFKSELRSYPKLNILSSQARELLPVKQSVPVLYQQDVIQDLKAFNLIQAYYVSRFYSEATHHNIDIHRLAASMAGIIANSGDWGSMRPWQNVVNAYKVAGIDLDLSEISATQLSFLSNWAIGNEI